MVFGRIRNILVGCLLVVVLLIVLGAVFAGTIAKKIISGVITQKTGVNVNVNDLKTGNLSYTDPKTGTTLNVGANKIPDDFPKDFPIYPNSTVTTSLTGNPSQDSTNTSGIQEGFWLTLVSKETPETVVNFYTKSLPDYGWNAQIATSAGNGTNWAISKGKWSGYTTVQVINGQTTILVVLQQDVNLPSGN